MKGNKRSNPLSLLLCLSLLSVLAQLSFFIIHSHAKELIDSLVSSSLPFNFFHFSVLAPLFEFFFLQVLAYALLLAFIWFLTKASAKAFACSTYYLALFFWGLSALALLALNEELFPDSFFGEIFPQGFCNELILGLTLSLLLLGLGLAYYRFFRSGENKGLGFSFLTLGLLTLMAAGFNVWTSQPLEQDGSFSGKPNIIFIGLDSFRPDFATYFNDKRPATPQVDQFLKTSLVLRDAYTPLARTFPSWISILTGKHPKHSNARINLADPNRIVSEDTLAKALKRAGYETLYATDEKRFSNISPDYGFDKVLGPGMGLSDFILGGLSDFPLTNLLINLPFGPYLFPFNYGNRAAAITYEPDNFLHLVKAGLKSRKHKPLFLAIHLCLSHWPYTWAKDHQGKDLRLDERYQSAVLAVDAEFGKILTYLKESGLLQHSIVVLLSDHGTTLGLRGDRILTKKGYQGEARKLKWVTVSKFNTADPYSVNFKEDFSLNTSYGQGTDVLSLKQYHVLLAIKGYGLDLPARELSERASLLDLTPTVLAYLHLPPLKGMDGRPLALLGGSSKQEPRAFFIETGHSIAELETDKIKVEKVVEKDLASYGLNPKNGLLYIDPRNDKNMIEEKQRAVLLGDWLLAYYPKSERYQLTDKNTDFLKALSILPAFYVLVNVKSGAWTIGFDSPLAKQAPLAELRKDLEGFYGRELES